MYVPVEAPMELQPGIGGIASMILEFTCHSLSSVRTGPIAALSKALSLALPRLTILGPNRVASLRALLGVSTDQLPATSREDLPEALRFPFSGAEATVMILVQRGLHQHN